MRITKLKPLKRGQYRCSCCNKPKPERDQYEVKYSPMDNKLVCVCSSCFSSIGEASVSTYLQIQELQRHLNLEEIGELIHGMDNTQIEQLLERLKKYGTKG